MPFPENPLDWHNSKFKIQNSKLLIIAVLMLASLVALAQAPAVVPSRMEFAGIRLKITESAKREIGETLDLLTRSRYHFQLKVDRSNLYMHFVEEVLRKEKIPEDFKYLAIQEGGFVSDAVSTSNAVGFWQFKKATARELGLRVDERVDERKHIIASTIGAAKYFKRSNFVFDNWVLTLQSYLQGLAGTQGSVSEKYYGAKKLEINKKTHWYVKKFIAHKLAFQDFVGEGRKHPKVRLASFECKGKSLRRVSQQVKVDYKELKRFNKWLSQSKVPAEKPYKVIYPVKNDPITNNDLPRETARGQNKKVTAQRTSGNAKLSRKTGRRFEGVRPVEGNVGVFPRITGDKSREYEPGNIKLNGIPAVRAKAGERLATLARRTGLSTRKLKAYNDISAKGKVRPGRYYYLKKKWHLGKVHYHVVRPGETLWSISQDYGIRLKKLLHKNRMRKEEPLKAGRVLWLRFIRPAEIPVEYSNVKVAKSVAAEDRLIQEVTPSYPQVEKEKKTAKAENEASPKVQPEESQKVLVPPKKKKKLVASQTDTIVVHKVKPKESFFGLSSQYGVEIDDILDWNGLHIMDGLRIGQQLNLIVPKSHFKAKEPTAKLATKTEQVHEVKKGETLWSISRKYGVTIEELLKWNDKENNTLSPGEKLKIMKF